jgi:hypothetical protein
MTTSDFAASIVALACWTAAKEEPHTVMLAVCQVFLNRARANSSDIYDEAIDYLEINSGSFPDTRSPQFQALVAKISLVMEGQVPDKTGGALWFAPKSILSQSPDLLEPFSITSTFSNMVFCK